MCNTLIAMSQRSIAMAQAAVYASINDFNSLNALDSKPAKKLVSAIRRYRSDHQIASDQDAFLVHRTENQRVAAGGKRRRKRGPRTKKEDGVDDGSVSTSTSPPSISPLSAIHPPLPQRGATQSEEKQPDILSSSCRNCDDLQRSLDNAINQAREWMDEARQPCRHCARQSMDLKNSTSWPVVLTNYEKWLGTVYQYFGELRAEDAEVDGTALFDVVYRIATHRPPYNDNEAYFAAILADIEEVKDRSRRTMLLGAHQRIIKDNHRFPDDLLAHAYERRYCNENSDVAQLRAEIHALESEAAIPKLRAEYEHRLKSADDQYQYERESLFKALAEADTKIKALKAEVASLKSNASPPTPRCSSSSSSLVVDEEEVMVDYEDGPLDPSL